MASKNQKRVRAVWRGGFSFEGITEAGQTVPMDSPVAPGVPTGPSPMELLLISLAGCTAMDVISILRKKRQDVTGLEINVIGDRVEEHPKRYTDIELEFVIHGRDVDPGAVARAIELSEGKYCSISAGLRPKATIVSRFRIENEPALAQE
jgi:putative redox protein